MCKNVFFKKSLLKMLAFSIFSFSIFSYSSLGVTAGEMNECSECLEVPVSNVTDEEFNSILNKVFESEEYKSLAEETIIGELDKDSIIIEKFQNVASVNFMIGEKVSSDHLVNVEFIYLVDQDLIYAEKLLYGQLQDNGLINISMKVNGFDIFSMDLDEKGNIVGDDGAVISQIEFYENVIKELEDNSSFVSRGWCEWAVGALCGTGGGVGCYALAAALGITTGIGGVTLAGVCGLIASLGCTAATKFICG